MVQRDGTLRSLTSQASYTRLGGRDRQLGDAGMVGRQLNAAAISSPSS